VTKAISLTLIASMILTMPGMTAWAKSSGSSSQGSSSSSNNAAQIVSTANQALSFMQQIYAVGSGPNAYRSVPAVPATTDPSAKVAFMGDAIGQPLNTIINLEATPDLNPATVAAIAGDTHNVDIFTGPSGNQPVSPLPTTTEIEAVADNPVVQQVSQGRLQIEEDAGDLRLQENSNIMNQADSAMLDGYTGAFKEDKAQAMAALDMANSDVQEAIDMATAAQLGSAGLPVPFVNNPEIQNLLADAQEDYRKYNSFISKADQDQQQLWNTANNQAVRLSKESSLANQINPTQAGGDQTLSILSNRQKQLLEYTSNDLTQESNSFSRVKQQGDSEYQTGQVAIDLLKSNIIPGVNMPGLNTSQFTSPTWGSNTTQPTSLIGGFLQATKGLAESTYGSWLNYFYPTTSNGSLQAGKWINQGSQDMSQGWKAMANSWLGKLFSNLSNDASANPFAGIFGGSGGSQTSNADPASVLKNSQAAQTLNAQLLMNSYQNKNSPILQHLNDGYGFAATNQLLQMNAFKIRFLNDEKNKALCVDAEDGQLLQAYAQYQKAYNANAAVLQTVADQLGQLRSIPGAVGLNADGLVHQISGELGNIDHALTPNPIDPTTKQPYNIWTNPMTNPGSGIFAWNTAFLGGNGEFNGYLNPITQAISQFQQQITPIWQTLGLNPDGTSALDKTRMAEFNNYTNALFQDIEARQMLATESATSPDAQMANFVFKFVTNPFKAALWDTPNAVVGDAISTVGDLAGWQSWQQGGQSWSFAHVNDIADVMDFYGGTTEMPDYWKSGLYRELGLTGAYYNPTQGGWVSAGGTPLSGDQAYLQTLLNPYSGANASDYYNVDKALTAATPANLMGNWIENSMESNDSTGLLLAKVAAVGAYNAGQTAVEMFGFGAVQGEITSLARGLDLAAGAGLTGLEAPATALTATDATAGGIATTEAVTDLSAGDTATAARVVVNGPAGAAGWATQAINGPLGTVMAYHFVDGLRNDVANFFNDNASPTVLANSLTNFVGTIGGLGASGYALNPEQGLLDAYGHSVTSLAMQTALGTVGANVLGPAVGPALGEMAGIGVADELTPLVLANPNQAQQVRSSQAGVDVTPNSILGVMKYSLAGFGDSSLVTLGISAGPLVNTVQTLVGEQIALPFEGDGIHVGSDGTAAPGETVHTSLPDGSLNAPSSNATAVPNGALEVPAATVRPGIDGGNSGDLAPIELVAEKALADASQPFGVTVAAPSSEIVPDGERGLGLQLQATSLGTPEGGEEPSGAPSVSGSLADDQGLARSEGNVTGSVNTAKNIGFQDLTAVTVGTSLGEDQGAPRSIFSVPVDNALHDAANPLGFGTSLASEIAQKLNVPSNATSVDLKTTASGASVAPLEEPAAVPASEQTVGSASLIREAGTQQQLETTGALVRDAGLQAVEKAAEILDPHIGVNETTTPNPVEAEVKGEMQPELAQVVPEEAVVPKITAEELTSLVASPEPGSLTSELATDVAAVEEAAKKAGETVVTSLVEPVGKAVTNGISDLETGGTASSDGSTVAGVEVGINKSDRVVEGETGESNPRSQTEPNVDRLNPSRLSQRVVTDVTPEVQQKGEWIRSFGGAEPLVKLSYDSGRYRVELTEAGDKLGLQDKVDRLNSDLEKIEKASEIPGLFRKQMPQILQAVGNPRTFIVEGTGGGKTKVITPAITYLLKEVYGDAIGKIVVLLPDPSLLDQAYNDVEKVYQRLQMEPLKLKASDFDNPSADLLTRIEKAEVVYTTRDTVKQLKMEASAVAQATSLEVEANRSLVENSIAIPDEAHQLGKVDLIRGETALPLEIAAPDMYNALVEVDGNLAKLREDGETYSGFYDRLKGQVTPEKTFNADFLRTYVQKTGIDSASLIDPVSDEMRTHVAALNGFAEAVSAAHRSENGYDLSNEAKPGQVVPMSLGKANAMMRWADAAMAGARQLVGPRLLAEAGEWEPTKLADGKTDDLTSKTLLMNAETNGSAVRVTDLSVLKQFMGVIELSGSPQGAIERDVISLGLVPPKGYETSSPMDRLSDEGMKPISTADFTNVGNDIERMSQTVAEGIQGRNIAVIEIESNELHGYEYGTELSKSLETPDRVVLLQQGDSVEVLDTDGSVRKVPSLKLGDFLVDKEAQEFYLNSHDLGDRGVVIVLDQGNVTGSDIKIPLKVGSLITSLEKVEADPSVLLSREEMNNSSLDPATRDLFNRNSDGTGTLIPDKGAELQLRARELSVADKISRLLRGDPIGEQDIRALKADLQQLSSRSVERAGQILALLSEQAESSFDRIDALRELDLDGKMIPLARDLFQGVFQEYLKEGPKFVAVFGDDTPGKRLVQTIGRDRGLDVASFGYHDQSIVLVSDNPQKTMNDLVQDSTQLEAKNNKEDLYNGLVGNLKEIMLTNFDHLMDLSESPEGRLAVENARKNFERNEGLNDNIGLGQRSKAYQALSQEVIRLQEKFAEAVGKYIASFDPNAHKFASGEIEQKVTLEFAKETDKPFADLSLAEISNRFGGQALVGRTFADAVASIGKAVTEKDLDFDVGQPHRTAVTVAQNLLAEAQSRLAEDVGSVSDGELLKIQQLAIRGARSMGDSGSIPYEVGLVASLAASPNAIRAALLRNFAVQQQETANATAVAVGRPAAQIPAISVIQNPNVAVEDASWIAQAMARASLFGRDFQLAWNNSTGFLQSLQAVPYTLRNALQGQPTAEERVRWALQALILNPRVVDPGVLQTLAMQYPQVMESYLTERRSQALATAAAAHANLPKQQKRIAQQMIILFQNLKTIAATVPSVSGMGFVINNTGRTSNFEFSQTVMRKTNAATAMVAQLGAYSKAANALVKVELAASAARDVAYRAQLAKLIAALNKKGAQIQLAAGTAQVGLVAQARNWISSLFNRSSSVGLDLTAVKQTRSQIADKEKELQELLVKPEAGKGSQAANPKKQLAQAQQTFKEIQALQQQESDQLLQLRDRAQVLAPAVNSGLLESVPVGSPMGNLIKRLAGIGIDAKKTSQAVDKYEQAEANPPSTQFTAGAPTPASAVSSFVPSAASMRAMLPGRENTTLILGGLLTAGVVAAMVLPVVPAAVAITAFGVAGLSWLYVTRTVHLSARQQTTVKAGASIQPQETVTAKMPSTVPELRQVPLEMAMLDPRLRSYGPSAEDIAKLAVADNVKAPPVSHLSRLLGSRAAKVAVMLPVANLTTGVLEAKGAQHLASRLLPTVLTASNLANAGLIATGTILGGILLYRHLSPATKATIKDKSIQIREAIGTTA
jgi:hypothetical protein